MKAKNLPNFTQRFKPEQKGLVSEDRNENFSVGDLLTKQINQFNKFLDAVRDNIQPEFDPNFVARIDFISANRDQLSYDARMFQFVVYNASSVILTIGLLGQGGLPNQIAIASNRYFISPAYTFSELDVTLSAAPATLAIPIVFAYNRILFAPGLFTI